MPVVGGPVTVDGNADLDLMLSEKFAERLAQQHTVGVDPQVQAAGAIGSAARSAAMIRRSRAGPASKGSPPCRTTCTAGSA